MPNKRKLLKPFLSGLLASSHWKAVKHWVKVNDYLVYWRELEKVNTKLLLHLQVIREYLPDKCLLSQIRNR